MAQHKVRDGLGFKSPHHHVSVTVPIRDLSGAPGDLAIVVSPVPRALTRRSSIREV
jgi:hypothetical protein